MPERAEMHRQPARAAVSTGSTPVAVGDRVALHPEHAVDVRRPTSKSGWLRVDHPADRRRRASPRRSRPAGCRSAPAFIQRAHRRVERDVLDADQELAVAGLGRRLLDEVQSERLGQADGRAARRHWAFVSVIARSSQGRGLGRLARAGAAGQLARGRVDLEVRGRGVGVAEAALERRVVVDRAPAAQVVHRRGRRRRRSATRGSRPDGGRSAARSETGLGVLRAPARRRRSRRRSRRARRAARPRRRPPPPGWASARPACATIPGRPCRRPARQGRRSRRARCRAPPRRSRARRSRRSGSGKRAGRRRGPSNSESTRASGTNTSSATASWLPVPRRPSVCQVSRTSRSAFGIATTERAARSGPAPPSAMKQPAKSRSAWSIPLQKPTGRRPRPRRRRSRLAAGAQTPAAIARPSPNSSVRRPPGGRRRAGCS